MQVAISQPAPDFSLPDQQGQLHNLADYRGRWVVLYFYPKDDTPGCTAEACNMRDHAADFAAHKVVVLGVSADNQASHHKFATKFNLNFPLLSDPDKSVIQAYGVWVEKSMFGKKYLGIDRQTFLIDPQGRIAKVYPKVNPTQHTQQLLQDIQHLSQSSPMT